MSLGFTEIPQDQLRIPGDTLRLGVTPYFKFENIYNEVKSQIEGKPVYELKEVVELRFAGDSKYRPVLDADGMAEADGNGRVVTWAERYKSQYQQFISGAAQQADGTPLEELLAYGMTQAQLSICRALDVHSVEALDHLEGPGLKRMGQHGNDLKPLARRYLENRQNGVADRQELDDLKRQVQELLAMQTNAPTVVVEAETRAMTADEVKSEIARITGTRPRGNPSSATLAAMLAELTADEASS